jgi:hypothetical protein
VRCTNHAVYDAVRVDEVYAARRSPGQRRVAVGGMKRTTSRPSALKPSRLEKFDGYGSVSEWP